MLGFFGAHIASKAEEFSIEESSRMDMLVATGDIGMGAIRKTHGDSRGSQAPDDVPCGCGQN
jgi:hypothetical protein